MAAPTLTQAEIDVLTSEKAKQEDVAATFAAAVPTRTARAAELEIQDGAFKKFFDYYNDDIVGQYDAERKEFDGLFIISPIVEDDILKPANLEFHRTTPTLPVTDIIRVVEFDGGGTDTTIVNELQHIADQLDAENTLQNGYGSGTPTSAVTTTSLTGASTTLNVTNGSAETITNGDVYVVFDGSNTAVIQVDNLTDGSGGNPPFLSNLDITIIVAGNVSIGADLIVFTGFTDAERNTKTATDPNLQPLMDSLIQDLEDLLNDRVARLDAQDTAIDANEDPDAVAQLAAQKALNGISRTFINNYLISTDISDTGLTSLATERGTRGTEITTRIAQIVANYTGQTENYYDRRYVTGNDRGSTSRGTLRLQKDAEQGIVASQEYSDNAQALVDALDALLS